jgi:hypothetical protein
MKRFYCSICKKIKRVRKMPRVIETPNAAAPADRVGICNHHTVTSKSNYKVNHVAS